MTADLATAQVVTAKDAKAAAYAALCAEERGSVRFVSSCSEKQQSLLVECSRLVDPAKLRKVVAWLRADRGSWRCKPRFHREVLRVLARGNRCRSRH